MDNDDPKVIRKIRKLSMRIDRALCIGAATCVALAPKAWAMDNEAKAIILDTCEEETDEMLIEAARSCPILAIFITGENGKQLFP